MRSSKASSSRAFIHFVWSLDSKVPAWFHDEDPASTLMSTCGRELEETKSALDVFCRVGRLAMSS